MRRIAADYLVEALIAGFPLRLAILEASRLEALQAKYPKIDPELLLAFAKADPSSLIDQNSQELKKAGGYTDWLIRQYLKMDRGHQSRILEDLPGYAGALSLYHRIKNKLPAEARDINKLNMAALLDLMDDARRTGLVKGKETQDGDVSAKKIYDDGNILVVIPLTHAASCKYGSHTRWCTTYSTADSYFNQYSREGPLFIIIDRQKDEKWQLHFESGQYMDATDSPVPLTMFVKELPVAAREAIIANARSRRAYSLLPEKVIAMIKGGDYRQTDVEISDLCAWWCGGLIEDDEFNATLVSSTHMNEPENVLKLIQARGGGIWVGVQNATDLADIYDTRRTSEEWLTAALDGDLMDFYDSGYRPDARQLSDQMTPDIFELAREIAKMNPDLGPDDEDRDYDDLWEEDEEIIEALQQAWEGAERSGYEAESTREVVGDAAGALGAGEWNWRGGLGNGLQFKLINFGRRVPAYLSNADAMMYADLASFHKNFVSHLVDACVKTEGKIRVPDIQGDFDDEYFEMAAKERLGELKHEREKNAPEPEEPAPAPETPEEGLPDPAIQPLPDIVSSNL